MSSIHCLRTMFAVQFVLNLNGRVTASSWITDFAPGAHFVVIVDDDKVKLASTLEMDVLRHGTNVDMVIARRHKGNCVNT